MTARAAKNDGGSYIGCADVAITTDGTLPDYSKLASEAGNTLAKGALRALQLLVSYRWSLALSSIRRSLRSSFCCSVVPSFFPSVSRTVVPSICPRALLCSVRRPSAL